VVLLFFIFLGVEPEIRVGLLFPQFIAGEGEIGTLYNPAATVYLSRQDFSFGIFGDGYLKRTDPYSGRYFQASGEYAAVRAVGIGGVLRWRFFWFATGKVGGGYYRGDIDRAVVDSTGRVVQEKVGRSSLGLFMAWDIYRSVGRHKIGGEFKINYLPFGGRSEKYVLQENLDPFKQVSLTGVGLSLLVCL